MNILPGYKQPELSVLAELPGNTAKSHGRPYSTWLFFRFPPGSTGRAGRMRGFLRLCLARKWHTSLLEQLNDWSAYRAAKEKAKAAGFKLRDDDPVATKPFGSVMLTQKTFRILDPELDEYGSFVWGHDAFNNGMKAQRHLLLDYPPPGMPAPGADPWAGHGYEADFDLVIMVAGNTRPHCRALADEVKKAAGDASFQLEEVHREDGFVWQPDSSGMREPFGFLDGLSNLLFLDEDYHEFLAAGGGVWDPRGTWQQLLYMAPTGSNASIEALEGGSFVVLRKLEQDIAMLRDWEKQRSPEAAEALIGRTRNGLPLAGEPKSRLNNFNYGKDRNATKCPFHAHIRKANPRESSNEGAGERSVLFVRRGMVYGPEGAETSKTLPDDGVGLLFLGYMGSIERQFRPMQVNWLGHDTFLHPAQDDRDALVAPPWARTRQGLGGLVKPRGGGYFFAPPLCWLRTL